MWMRIFMDMRRVGMIVVYMPRNVIFFVHIIYRKDQS